MLSYVAIMGLFGLAATCEGPGVDPWVGDLRDRVTAYNSLAHFAREQYGEPLACAGSVTTEFDGAKFGIVLLTFPGGVTLEVETMPPETSLVTLTHPAGFGDGVAVKEAVRAHTAGIGLAVDWEAPEESMEGDQVVRRFWDPDPGLNASASLYYSGGTLMAVRVSMAL